MKEEKINRIIERVEELVSSFDYEEKVISILIYILKI